MFELYIFNKEAPSKNGLSYWDSEDFAKIFGTLTFSLDRFRFKDNSYNLLSEFAQELTYLYKETDSIKVFFEKYSGSSIEIGLADDYHHIVTFDFGQIILDSKIQNKLMPVYLFAIYYAFSRQNKSENAIYETMHEFFMHFDFRAIKTIIDFLERDKENNRTYDAGGHLLDYLKGIQTRNNKKGLLATQLLRNRALAGSLPFDTKAFEFVSEKHKEDLFSSEAISEYFEAYKSSFNKNFAPVYYSHLCTSLNKIGLGIVAQRGSRVAHEQGPILVNSGKSSSDEDFTIKIRKLKSIAIEIISKIEEQIYKSKQSFLQNNLSKFANSDLDSLAIKLSIDMDCLLYLAEQKEFAKARFEKHLLDFKKNYSDFLNQILHNLEQKKNKKDKFWTYYDLVQSSAKQLAIAVHEIEESLQNIKFEHQKAVIYVQRPSSRSGHFIPRIILGQNLYIETDDESEKERIKAIPYNFVVPDLDLIACGIDSFFENASISIVTDRETGKPEIKWENAEDLALSLAPSIFRSIKSSESKNHKFHYQLETTLFGPLIEVFKALLENEMSIIASIDRYSNILEDKNQSQKGLDKILESYQNEILNAANFVFDYYLLEDDFINFMLIESLSKIEAIYQFILGLRDVQNDLAAFCILNRSNPDYLQTILNEYKTSPKDDRALLAQQISAKLRSGLDRKDLKIFIKKYFKYPESTARKEFLANYPEINRLTVSSDKNFAKIDYPYIFSVAPSRIDFGKHVVASVTSLMGRILGADDSEALNFAKQYLDLVSKSSNSLFESATEAGSVKVIENTCRALQYSKAISFQGVFQDFGIDGLLARMTINSRNTKAAGIHIMEYGTMASTGYCITKEPLFILLGFSLTFDDFLEKLGIQNSSDREDLKKIFTELLQDRHLFTSHLDWQLHAYEEMIVNPLIQKYFTNKDFKWLINLESLSSLLKYISDNSPRAMVSRTYHQLTAKLIEFGRVINETGIIQRVHLMNFAIAQAQNKLKNTKGYNKVKIALNAAYKGNVSDERENANQYLLMLLLGQKQYLKNTSIPEIKELIDHQIKEYSIPGEIRIIDPYVDKEIFMNGELKTRAFNCISELCSLPIDPPLNKEIIEACVLSYGSDYTNWRILSKRQIKDKDLVDRVFTKLFVDLKLLEIYTKGFYKDPLQGFQGLDLIQLNADHDQIKTCLESLVKLKDLMMINNPDSLLILIDNPQQAKKPFLDYDRSLEWMSLGGTLASHMVSQEIYSRWFHKIQKESTWAKLFMQKLLYEKQDDHSNSEEYIEITNQVHNGFLEIQRYLDLERDLIHQKFLESFEMGSSLKTLNRYQEILECYSRVIHYQSVSEIDFRDWLILGGRWILNGQKIEDINYAVNLFENSGTLSKLGKYGFETMNLFVTASQSLILERQERIIDKAGSTKEGDLTILDAVDNINLRAQSLKRSQNLALRAKSIQGNLTKLDFNSLEEIFQKNCDEYIYAVKSNDENLKNSSFAKILSVILKFSQKEIFDEESKSIVQSFIKTKEAEYLTEFFGDHRKHFGLFAKLCAKSTQEEHLHSMAKFAEMIIFAYLIFLTFDVEDPNLIINKLTIFFDQYLNIHEEDYPPYAFHSLCAGSSYGFLQTYYLNQDLRIKMFKLACQTGLNIYKLLHFLISQKTILKHSSYDYVQALIGDAENGILPICYQHETISIEERFWDCMRALRNFVRNYHDRHPLPIIVKFEDATVANLFITNPAQRLVFIAGLASPGKHSWDMNCVFRSPKLRSRNKYQNNGQAYTNISIFTPFLTKAGEIKQIYTAFDPRIIEERKICYLAPFQEFSEGLEKGNYGYYALNQENFVHAIVSLNGPLPKPDITMSAHTHSQYINEFTLNLGIPEVWSLLNMQQMYAKTELKKILNKADLLSLAQIEFFQKEFQDDKEALIKAFDKRLAGFEHIEFWILKASRDSGGRGISSRLSLSKDRQEILDFIWDKIQSDDLVMQEFVPNNARAFIKTEFLKNIEDQFINDGLGLSQITPYESMYFAMRSFQSLSGIKGYLYSVNIGAVTVNAGQGAKMFYGEPLHIMPIYIAGKIQNLMDEYGEILLKHAIPEHAKDFAKAQGMQIKFNNIYMLNGLFDYIPYLFVKRFDSEDKSFKVFCQDNSRGGIDYCYYHNKTKILLCSGSSHQSSITALEKILKDFANGDYKGPESVIDFGLAVLELNSGLGQANLLHKAVLELAPEKVDLFLEWTEDLGALALNLDSN